MAESDPWEGTGSADVETAIMRGLFAKPGWQGMLMLAPALLVYLVFALYPAIDVFRLSFVKWNGLDPEKIFVGFDNYRHILTNDPVFWGAFRNTIVWTVLSVIFPPLAGFLLALSLNQRIWARNTLRAIFYMPVIIASIAVATMWRWMYDPIFGVVSYVMMELGCEGLIQDWLGDSDVALYSVFIAYIWQTMGVSMVLFLAGLQNVEETLVEAAHIDGASRWQVFRHVTMPAIRPTITIVLVLAVIDSLKAFDIVYGMTGGGPAESTQMLALWSFVQSMKIYDFGRGSAIAVVLFVLTLLVVVPYLFWTQKRKAQE